MNRWCVYVHRNPKTMRVFYVGIGSSISRPFSRDRSIPWENYVKKHGDPVVCVILDGLSEASAKEAEVLLIDLAGRRSSGGPLVNITAGGDDQPMRYPEVVAKVRAAMIGRAFSDETRKRMSDAKKGKPIPEYLRKSLIERLAAGWHPMNSDEARKKQSKRQKGVKKSHQHCVKNGEVHSRAVDQLEVDGSFVKRHASLRVAAELVGCTSALIGMVCRGKCKSAKGFKWAYADGSQARTYIKKDTEDWRPARLQGA